MSDIKGIIVSFYTEARNIEKIFDKEHIEIYEKYGIRAIDNRTSVPVMVSSSSEYFVEGYHIYDYVDDIFSEVFGEIDTTYENDYLMEKSCKRIFDFMKKYNCYPHKIKSYGIEDEKIKKFSHIIRHGN